MGLAILVCLITGCTPTYHMTIENGQFKEEIQLQISEKDLTFFEEYKSLDYFLENNTYAYDSGASNEKYDKKVVKKNDTYYITLKYTHDPNKFEKSKALTFFKYHAYIQTKGSYFVKLTGGINTSILPAIPNTAIRIKTDNRVLQHNADKVEGNVYIWNINKSNGSSKELLFQVSKDQKEVVTKKGNIVFTGIISLAFIVLFTVLFWFLGKKIISAKV